MENKKLIDLNYAIRQLELGELEHGGNFETDSYHVKEFLSVLPTIDAVEVAHGMWIEDRTYSFDPYSRVHYKCSICGRIEENKEPYCNCGAKMDK